MTKKTDSNLPTIQEIPTKDLLVEDGFNVRLPKQFATNVAELSKLVEANGFIDGSIHVVQFIERDGKKYIRGGHTIHAVAQKLDYKFIPAVKVDFNPVQEQVNLVTSNAGHPLSAFEQGTVYIRLRDGQKPDDVAVGCEIRGPMTTKEISAAVGLTEQRIKDCIAIRESHADIAEMIEDGSISTAIVLRVHQLAKEHGKRMQLIKAAIKNAAENDQEKATMKNLDNIKASILPAPKLKAERNSKGKVAATAAGNQDAPESAQEGAGDAGSQSKSQDSGGIPGGAGDESPKPQSEMKLDELKVETPVQSKKHEDANRKLLAAIISKWGEREDVMCDDQEIDSLVEDILAAKIPF